jgi:DNA-directed RNA polymerase subunit RPC12/RpoP
MMSAATEVKLDVYRCSQCGRIIAKCDLKAGSTVEIKCKCGAMNTVQVR